MCGFEFGRNPDPADAVAMAFYAGALRKARAVPFVL
jgi:hypothetical protein